MKKNIKDKIKSNGFTKVELLRYKLKYNEIKQLYNPKITSELSLVKVIFDDAKDAFYNIKIYVFMFLFFVLGALAMSTGKDALVYSLIIFPVILFSIYSNAKNKGVKTITELKLIKLYLRSIF